jgi:hypothetical protein
VIQLDGGDGWGDKQWELPGAYHALGTFRGIETDWRLHPIVVRRYPGSRSSCRHLSVQGLDYASGCNVLGGHEHDMECFAMLVVARLRVRVAIHGLQHPLGVLKLHLLIFLLLGVHFCLPSTGGKVRLLDAATSAFHRTVPQAS